MSLSALLKDSRKLEEGLANFEPSKEEIEGGLAALSYANGVMTAAIASPEYVPSSEWLPLIANPSDELPGAGRMASSRQPGCFCCTKKYLRA